MSRRCRRRCRSLHDRRCGNIGRPECERGEERRRRDRARDGGRFCIEERCRWCRVIGPDEEDGIWSLIWRFKSRWRHEAIERVGERGGYAYLLTRRSARRWRQVIAGLVALGSLDDSLWDRRVDVGWSGTCRRSRVAGVGEVALLRRGAHAVSVDRVSGGTAAHLDGHIADLLGESRPALVRGMSRPRSAGDGW